jgi:two-component SAPR family response regulator
VYALGEGRVLRGDELVTNAEWGMAKSKELLFYLLCHKQRRKDQIGTDLWPELSPAKLRSSFHVALYRLRRALAQQDCVKYEDEQYFFNRSINHWFDVHEFEQAIRKAAAAWTMDRDQAARYYQEALALYQGDFLEDLTSDHGWCLLQREALLQRLLRALVRLGEYHVAKEKYSEAMHVYHQILEKDAYSEHAYREIMRCQALLGDRSAALKTYHRLAELLEEELGAEPARETTRLYERILQGRLGQG